MCSDNEILDFLTVQAMLNMEDSTRSKVSAAYIIAKKKFRDLSVDQKNSLCETINEMKIQSRWNNSDLFKKSTGEDIV